MKRSTSVIALVSFLAMTGIWGIALADDDDDEVLPACPVFTAAMVDAAAMVVDLKDDPSISVFAFDEPSTAFLNCSIARSLGETDFKRFSVDVNDDEEGDVQVSGSTIIGGVFNRVLASSARRLSVAELHACRAQVLQSLVWNQYCAPELPFPTDPPTDDDNDD